MVKTFFMLQRLLLLGTTVDLSLVDDDITLVCFYLDTAKILSTPTTHIRGVFFIFFLISRSRNSTIFSLYLSIICNKKPSGVP